MALNRKLWAALLVGLCGCPSASSSLPERPVLPRRSTQSVSVALTIHQDGNQLVWEVANIGASPIAALTATSASDSRDGVSNARSWVDIELDPASGRHIVRFLKLEPILPSDVVVTGSPLAVGWSYLKPSERLSGVQDLEAYPFGSTEPNGQFHGVLYRIMPWSREDEVHFVDPDGCKMVMQMAWTPSARAETPPVGDVVSVAESNHIIWTSPRRGDHPR